MDDNLRDLLLYLARREDITRERRVEMVDDVVFEIQDRLRRISQLANRVGMIGGDEVEMEVFDLEIHIDRLIEDLE